MTQYVINIGTSPNSGTGDQLRTAFNEVNLNFNQLFAAGPVGSNITIANNTIAVTNVNGNLILAPNGTGTVQTAGHLVPTIANVRNLGAYNNRFNTVYSQYLDAQSGIVSGNLTVGGNLVVTGNTVTVDTSTLNVANITIEVASGAGYPALADGAGLTVGGAGATWLYSAVANAWVSNLPVVAPTFIGDGSQLTNVSAAIDASAMTGNTIASTVLYSSLTSVGVLANLTVSGNAQFNQTITSNAINSGSITAIAYYGNGAGLSAVTGSNVTGTVGNATYATYAGTANVANLAALATQAVNSDTALYATRAGSSDTANTATFATNANCATYATNASLANSAVVAGRAETIDTQTTITVTGNIVAGGIKTDNYYFANGTPATFGGGSGNYSNANVAAYLPTYSGDLNNLGNITVYGSTNLGNTNINSTLTVGVVSASGNVSGGAVYANGFFYGNGAPFTGSGFVLGDQQFYGNGSAGPYTMTQSSTDNAVLVTINGLTQTPGTTYFVSGNTISFSDGININELVDIRFLGTGSGSGTSTYANANVQAFLNSGTLAGNIIPSGNAVYSLGNASHQWNDLWVSNATIYLNSIPLSVNGNGSLTFDGSPIVTTSGSDNLVVTGDVTANAFIGDGSQLTGITATANTGNIGFNGDTVYDLSGMTLNNGDLSHGSTSGLVIPSNGNTTVPAQFVNTYGNIQIIAGNGSGNTSAWRFDSHGNLILPSIDDVAIVAPENNLTINANNYVYIDSLGAGQIEIGTSEANVGVVILGSTTKNTVIRSEMAEFDGNISAIGNVTAGNITGNVFTGNYFVGNGLYGNETDDTAVLGNASGLIQVYAQNTGVGIQTYDTPNLNYHTWSFGMDGNLYLPDGDNISINYANGQPYGGSGGANIGNLSVNGAVILLANGAPETQVEISPNPEGWSYVQVPNDATANVANLRIHNDAGNIEIAAGDTSNSGPVHYMYLDNTGNLSVPVNINFNGGGLQQVTNEDFYIRANDDEADGWSIYNVVGDGAGNDLTHTRLEYNQYTVRTNIQGASPYTWAFRESGALELPGDIFGNVGNSLTIRIGDQSGSDTFIDLQTRSYAGNALISNIHIAPNVTVSTANAAYNWTFNSTGVLQFPRDVTGNTDPYLSIEGGSNPSITSTDVSLAGPANLGISANYTNFTGFTGNAVSIYADDGAVSTSANLVLTSNAAGNTNSWTFGTTGNLTLPTISLGAGVDEQTTIQSQRKLIPPFRWSAAITADTPTVVYTATDVNTTSMKVTMQVQHDGLGMELFEVFATYTGSTDTFYAVTNRVAPPAIAATDVLVDLNGSNTMQITLTVNSGAGTSWVTYDAVEFGIPND